MKPPEYLTTEHFECQCSSDEHTLKFTLDELSGDIEELEIWTSVFLHSEYHGFWGRLWIAIKYLFGYKSRYGHFDCFIMRAPDVDRMIALLQKYKSLQAKLEAKESAKECFQRATANPSSTDIGQIPQELGPFCNAPENFQ